MADTVNPRITDAVTQTNVKVVGEAPAIALSTVYQQEAAALPAPPADQTEGALVQPSGETPVADGAGPEAPGA